MDWGKKTMDMIEESIQLVRKEEVRVSQDLKDDMKDVEKGKQRPGVFKKMFWFLRYSEAAGEISQRKKVIIIIIKLLLLLSNYQIIINLSLLFLYT